MTPIERVLEKLSGVKKDGDSGRQYMAHCPAHGDIHQSLAVGVSSDDRVLLHCFAGCPLAQIVAAIGLDMADLFDDSGKSLTLHELAVYCRLPADFLKRCYNLSTAADHRSGREKTYVAIPYRDESDTVLFHRERWKLRGEGKVLQPRGKKLALYNLWNLAEARREGYVVCVEGETDVWTLGYHNIPALGFPGVGAFKTVGLDHLRDIGRVYIWQEPGQGGVQFLRQLSQHLLKIGYPGQILFLSHARCKDPSDLHKADPEAFRASWDAAVAAAVPPTNGTDYLSPWVRACLDTSGGEKLPPDEFPLSDIGNGARLVHRHGRNLRFVPAWQRWYVWDGSRWRSDVSGEAFRRATDTVLAIHEEAAAIQPPPNPTVADRVAADARRDRCNKWAEHSASVYQRNAMLTSAGSHATVSVHYDQFDTAPFLFNCVNGTIDLTRSVLRPADPSDRITQLCPVAYDPAAKCPHWHAFLARTFPLNPSDPDSPPDTPITSFLQRLFGYALTGSIRDHVLPVFWGLGRNGKSTVVITMMRLFGEDYATKASDDLLMATYHERHPTEVAALYRKRIVFASETREGRRLDEVMVKSLTGGEILSARRMREDLWDFQPTHKIILSTNYQPDIRGTDDGIWSRMLKIPFRVRFWKDSDPIRPGDVRLPHHQADPLLIDKLEAELPGILAWCVAGCRDWLAGGLAPPPAVTRATEEYRQEMDTVAEFMDDCLEATGAVSDQLTVSSVYARYESWARSCGEEPRSKKWLSANLARRGLGQTRDMRDRYWTGVKIRNRPSVNGTTRHQSLEDFDE